MCACVRVCVCACACARASACARVCARACWPTVCWIHRSGPKGLPIFFPMNFTVDVQWTYSGRTVDVQWTHTVDIEILMKNLHETCARDPRSLRGAGLQDKEYLYLKISIFFSACVCLLFLMRFLHVHCVRPLYVHCTSTVRPLYVHCTVHREEYWESFGATPMDPTNGWPKGATVASLLYKRSYHESLEETPRRQIKVPCHRGQWAHRVQEWQGKDCEEWHFSWLRDTLRDTRYSALHLHKSNGRSTNGRPDCAACANRRFHCSWRRGTCKRSRALCT